MSVQIRGAVSNTSIADVDAGTLALRVTPRGADVGANGSYILAASTGDLTTIAAGTASAGFLFAFRWAQLTQICVINKLRVRWYTNAGFTAAQLVGISAYIGRGYTVSSSGGTAITGSASAMAKRASYGNSNVADARVSTTAALTAGTVTLDPQPIAIGYAREMAAAATLPGQVISLSYEWDQGQSMPIQLTQNTGIIVRNEVLMGAGGTARVVVELDWSECTAY